VSVETTRSFKVGRFLAAAVVASVPFTAQAAEKPGDGVTITMAKPTWDTGWFQVELYKAMLRELGYEFRRSMTLDNPAFYQSVGQGDIDLWVNGWFPNHKTYEDAYAPGAKLHGYVAKGGALQGYLVSKTFAEKYDIKYLSDFKRPEVKEAFDSNGDGKADLVACPPGWGCEEVITHHMDAYDLRDHVTPLKANYSAGMADALGKHKNGEPVFFYTWTPNWTVGLMKPGKDVVWITVKETRHPRGLSAEQTTVTGMDSCVADPCNLGWGVSDIRPVANKEFLEENPAASKLIETVRIPIQDIFAQNAKMFNGEDSQEDLERHATEWLKENQDMVDGWLEEARAAAE
jgi:glycine betaine/proline transport system substrate-binding protein